MNEIDNELLQKLLAHLPAGWAALYVKATSLLFTWRLLVKPALFKFQGWLTAKVHAAALSDDKTDDTIWLRILSSRSYKFGAFLVDTFLSVKLPSEDSLLLHEIKLPEPVYPFNPDNDGTAVK